MEPGSGPWFTGIKKKARLARHHLRQKPWRRLKLPSSGLLHSMAVMELCLHLARVQHSVSGFGVRKIHGLVSVPRLIDQPLILNHLKFRRCQVRRYEQWPTSTKLWERTLRQYASQVAGVEPVFVD
jgi:hypothetical protein